MTCNGHPVFYVPRYLSRTDQKYGNIEPDGLTVVFAVTTLLEVLLGRTSKLNTDQKPLDYFFSPKSQLPKVIWAQLASWAITLMVCNYDVQESCVL